MEAWLAQLDMDVDLSIPTSINNSYHQYQQSETIEVSFDEQLAATLGEDFPYPLSGESHTTSPQLDFDCDVIEQFLLPQIPNNNNNYNKDNDKIHSSNNVQEDTQHCMNKEESTRKQATRGGTKRKRQPNQVQDHIIAERRRRELLSQMFISLSAIVPGLKKVDKTSVLGEAIKYMKQLQEKVKVLEDVAAKRTVESVVVVKKSQLIVDDDKGGDDNESSSTVDDNCDGGNGSNGNGGNSNESNNMGDSLPEIEIKISGKTLLLRVYCEQQKGVLAKLFAEVDKHDINVTNCSVIPFESLALDITIVAQMENGFNKNVRDFVRTLHSALRLASHQGRVSSEDNHSS